MNTRWVVLAVVPLTVAAWLVRTALAAGLRRRSPRAAAAVDRCWAWVPLVVVLVAVTVASPLFGIVAGVATAAFLTSGRAVGSPFRPRR